MKISANIRTLAIAISTIGGLNLLTAHSALAKPYEAPQVLTINLQKINVVGNQSLPVDKINELTENYVYRAVTYAELKQLTRELEALYRSQGYLLAQVSLPEQMIVGGAIVIEVTEGKLISIKLANNSRVKDEVIGQYLNHKHLKGKVINKKALKHYLMITNELPGIAAVSSSVQATKEVGSNELLVTTAGDTKLLTQEFKINNHSNPYTLPYRLHNQTTLNNLTGYADKLRLAGNIGDKNNAAVELSWQIPIGSYGTKFTAFTKRSKYKLDETLLKPEEYGNGTSMLTGVSASYPLVRDDVSSMNMLAKWQYRLNKDHLVNTDEENHIKKLSLAVDSNSSKETSKTVGKLSLDIGKLEIKNQQTKLLDDAEHRAAGRFMIINGSIQRSQNITDRLLLQSRLQGQFANKNLDASQKFQLGGINAVRAYPTDEVAGDDALLATMNLAYQVSDNLMIGTGYDYAITHVNHRPITSEQASNRQIRQGAAVYVQGNYGSFDIGSTLGINTVDIADASKDANNEGSHQGSYPNSDHNNQQINDETRLWFNLGYQF